MRYRKMNQAGVSHLIVVLAIVVVAAVGFASYHVMTANKPAKQDTAATASQSSAKFQSKADVEQASRSLDDENVDSSLDSSQFNDDLNNLL